ncbi:MAG: SDR family NAD(P)-dependent oxidoreductase [Salibacteraceae bacterium]
MTDYKTKYGPWAIVAGASEGLGAAFAADIARRSINVILVARRQAELNDVSDKIEKTYGVKTIPIVADLSDITELEKKLNELKEDVGLLVYNAAYAPINYFTDVNWNDLNKVVDVNVKGPLFFSKWATNRMQKRKSGGIVLMSSLSGTQGSPKIASYAASKAFNTILAEGLWSELKPLGIDVVASCAGAIRTPGYANAKDTKEAPGTLDASEVARITLNNISNGPVVVPGFANQFFRTLLGRILPRKMAISIMDKNTKDLS